jgi:hypothetical protein
LRAAMGNPPAAERRPEVVDREISRLEKELASGSGSKKK